MTDQAQQLSPAQMLGRNGGLKRAANLSQKQKTAIAQKAANARWAKKKAQQ